MLSLRKKPKVCFLRGSYLNPFEIQYLEPLQDQFEIVLAHSTFQRYDLSAVKLPRLTVPCLDFLNGKIPRKIFSRPVPNFFKFFGYEEILLGLSRYLKGFDIVHVPEQSFYFTSQVAKLKQKIGFKLVTTQDEVNPFWYSHKPSIFKRTSEVRKLTDIFIARSERAKQALICEGVKPDKIFVIGHGIDSNKFYPGDKDSIICKKLGIRTDQFIILFVGRLVWTKGIFALADAAKLLLCVPEVKKLNPIFLIVGDGPEKNKFEHRLNLLGIRKYFQIAGDQPYQLLPDFHRLADIFVLPSISTRYILEQFGIVLIESMACANPVVTTHCGAIDEVVGGCGVLVQPNDYYRLSKAIETLIFDDKQRRQLGSLGKKRVDRLFTHSTISASIAKAYNCALSR